MKYPYKTLYVDGVKIDEHRYIIQEHIGRKLNRYEFVHHKNGNKKDNRIENLEIMDCHQHAIEHNQIFPIYKKCVVCGNEYTPNKTKRLRSKTCSKECCKQLNLLNASKRKKRIYQYDLLGNFIKEWDSATDIKNKLGFYESNICKCCKNNIKSAYGFKWSYAAILKTMAKGEQNDK